MPEPLDLRHLGHERVIGSYLLETEDGPLHVVVSQVAYYKRVVRAGRVGFAS